MVPDRWIEVQFANIEKDIKEINQCLQHLLDQLEVKYLTRNEWSASFVPIRNLLYTVIGGIIVGAVLYYLKMVAK